MVTFHAEAVAQDYARSYKERGWTMQLVCKQFYHLDRLEKTLSSIRGAGKRVGVAINPDTDVEVVEFLDQVDMVLVMTVWPGFGAQKFIEAALPKLVKLRKRAPSVDLQVDGGLNPETVRKAAFAGANVIVAGTATFRSDDMAGVVRALRENAEEARRGERVKSEE